MNHHLITLMLLFPFTGAIVQAFLSPRNGTPRWVALGASVGSSLCGIALVASMHTGTADLQTSVVFPWIESYAISYAMGLDGLNAVLVLLVSVIFPLLIAAEWNRTNGIRGMHGLLLVLQTAMLGAVCAQDMFLQFFFWALSALPFYFLIGIWGGKERETAAFRSIVASSLGNAFLFAALLLVYYSVDPHTFLLADLSGGKLEGKVFHFLGYDLSVSAVAFALVGIGLALRAPIWPLHGWFTQVAKEAPSSVFVALSAVSVPVALYLFIRLSYSLFPETVSYCANGIVAVGAINLILGGICAIAQRGLRLLLAFVCLSEVGLVLMGVGSLNPAGAVGAIFQVFAWGLALAGFGLFTGILLERTGSTQFMNESGKSTFGGVASLAPSMAVVAGVVVASLLGFPGLGGFVGHSLLMIGSYSIHPVAVIVAGIALLLATYYLFTMYRHIFLGQVSEEGKRFDDLTLRERAYLLPVVGCLLVFGIYPKPLIELVRPTVLTLLSSIK